MPDLYQQAVDVRVREDLLLGVAVPDGWRRPVPPMCPKHGYGMPDERGCGKCVGYESQGGYWKASLSGRAEFAEAPHRNTAVDLPGARPSARPESDEKAAA